MTDQPNPNFSEGVPFCAHDMCALYDGKRCRALGCRPDLVCEPAVREMAADRDRLVAEVRELRARIDQGEKVDAAVDVLQGATLEVLRTELAQAKADAAGAASALATSEHERLGLADQVERYRTALEKVNAIRNSIVGIQGFNFSEHAYPLVAALDEAGFRGMPYPEARENVGTLIERATKAEAEVERMRPVVEGVDAYRKWCAERCRHRSEAEFAAVNAGLDALDSYIADRASAAPAARESEANALRKALRMAEEHNALLLRERDEARAANERLKVLTKERRGANWAPPDDGSLCFLRVSDDSEVCFYCGRHIRYHYGGTEYRCHLMESTDG